MRVVARVAATLRAGARADEMSDAPIEIRLIFGGWWKQRALPATTPPESLIIKRPPYGGGVVADIRCICSPQFR